MDLNDHDEVLKLVEKEIYEICSNVLVGVKYSTAGNISAKVSTISPENQFYLIQEAMYQDSKFPMVHNKHYLPIKSSSIEFHQKSRKNTQKD